MLFRTLRPLWTFISRVLISSSMARDIMTRFVSQNGLCDSELIQRFLGSVWSTQNWSSGPVFTGVVSLVHLIILLRKPLSTIYQTVTVFAYGVTSSGKTHTIQGTKAQPGIIPRVVKVKYQLDSSRIFTETTKRTYFDGVHLSQI